MMPLSMTWTYSTSASDSLNVTASPANVEATVRRIWLDLHHIREILASSPIAILRLAKQRTCAPWGASRCAPWSGTVTEGHRHDIFN